MNVVFDLHIDASVVFAFDDRSEVRLVRRPADIVGERAHLGPPGIDSSFERFCGEFHGVERMASLYKLVEDTHSMYEVRDSAGVFLRHAGSGDFLFHLRDAKPDIADPDRWSLIGGSIDDGESPEQAAKREVFEEIGIRVEKLRYLATIDAVDVVKGVRHPLRIALFLSEIDVDANDIALTEGQQVRYFSLDAIMERDLKPEFKRFIFMRREDLER